MRKAINFFRSYYDIAKELSDKDRLLFYDAILNKQFENIEPALTGMSKFAYLSQKHSIDSQIKGYYDKTKDEKFNPLPPPPVGSTEPPPVQEEVKGEEQEEVKGELDKNSKKQLDQKNIILSIIEYEKLTQDFTEEITLLAIRFLSDYKIEKGYKTKNDNLTIRRWVIKAVKEQIHKDNQYGNKQANSNDRKASLNELSQLANTVLQQSFTLVDNNPSDSK